MVCCREIIVQAKLRYLLKINSAAKPRCLFSKLQPLIQSQHYNANSIITNTPKAWICFHRRQRQTFTDFSGSRTGPQMKKKKPLQWECQCHRVVFPTCCWRFDGEHEHTNPLSWYQLFYNSNTWQKYRFRIWQFTAEISAGIDSLQVAWRRNLNKNVWPHQHCLKAF